MEEAAVLFVVKGLCLSQPTESPSWLYSFFFNFSFLIVTKWLAQPSNRLFLRTSHMLPFFAEKIDSFPASSSGFPSGVIELTSASPPLQSFQHPTQDPRVCPQDTLGTVC